MWPAQIFSSCEFELSNEWRRRPKACKKSTAAARPRKLSLLPNRRSRLKKPTGWSRSAVAWAIPVGNCLEDTFEPLRLNPAENMLPEKEIPNSPNGLGRFGIVDYLLQKFVARRRHRA